MAECLESIARNLERYSFNHELRNFSIKHICSFSTRPTKCILYDSESFVSLLGVVESYVKEPMCGFSMLQFGQ